MPLTVEYGIDQFFQCNIYQENSCLGFLSSVNMQLNSNNAVTKVIHREVHCRD